MNFRKPRYPAESVDTLHFIVGAKIKALKGLAHEVLVEARHAWPLYQEAKETCRDIGTGSADRYDVVMEQLELAKTGDQQAWRKVVETLCPQAHARRQAEYDRINVLRDTVRATFPKRPDILYHARDAINRIGRQGGEQYDRTISLVKFARADLKANVAVMELFFPDTARKLAVQPAKQ